MEAPKYQPLLADGTEGQAVKTPGPQDYAQQPQHVTIVHMPAVSKEEDDASCTESPGFGIDVFCFAGAKMGCALLLVAY